MNKFKLHCLRHCLRIAGVCKFIENKYSKSKYSYELNKKFPFLYNSVTTTITQYWKSILIYCIRAKN